MFEIMALPGSMAILIMDQAFFLRVCTSTLLSHMIVYVHTYVLTENREELLQIIVWPNFV